MHYGEFSSFHLLLDLRKNLSTFHVSLKLSWRHSIDIFSCLPVLFIWLIGSWITQKTLPASGAACVC